VTILFNRVRKKTLKILPTQPKKSGKPTYPTKIRLGHQFGTLQSQTESRIQTAERERESLQQYTITTN